MGNLRQHRQRRSIGSGGRCAEVKPGVVFMLTSQLLLRLMARLLLLFHRSLISRDQRMCGCQLP